MTLDTLLQLYGLALATSTHAYHLTQEPPRLVMIARGSSLKISAQLTTGMGRQLDLHRGSQPEPRYYRPVMVGALDTSQSTALTELAGREALDLVILYGSRARGTGRP